MNEIPYRRFRTGLTFKDVRQWFITGGDDCTAWRHVTRNTVLGKWHQHKLEAYANYLKRIDSMITIQQATDRRRDINRDLDEGFSLLAENEAKSLYKDVIQAIADGCEEDPRRLATAALGREVG